jgi:fumarate hydratase class II
MRRTAAANNWRNTMTHRIEHDTLGEIDVPADRYWGAQTQRSLENFPIGPAGSMPREIIEAFAFVKKAAAITNRELDVLSEHKAGMITAVCDEILAGQLADEFPLVVWQTGSGTHTNMNVNEVIANRAHELAGGLLTDPVQELDPNDDVNRSQSSNDTFSTAMHVAAYKLTTACTVAGVRQLRDECARKSSEFHAVTKIGRTHLMDAVPVTLGQEFGAYAQQLSNALRAIDNALDMIREVALGGTAVGTGLNTPPGYTALVVAELARLTECPFVPAPDPFEALAAHDAMTELSSAFRRAAVSLMKIGNDIAMLASGPRAGLGELLLPANEPGSSIMPGKVNPTQAEALAMVAAQVMGNDVAVGIAGSNGHFELNVFKPVIAANVLQSARLLGDACASFAARCVSGITPNAAVIERHLNESLMMVTSLNPHIGYHKAAAIAQRAYAREITLKQAAIELGTVSAEEFDLWVQPRDMVGTTPRE